MDSDLLRLILLILGVLLVAGIYLWDRYKRSGLHLPRTPRKSRRKRQLEPTLDGEPPQASGAPADDNLPPGEFVGEPVVRHRWDTPTADKDSQLAMELTFSAQGESDYLHIDPALLHEVPRLIVQVVLIARDGPVSGKQIREALQTVDMRFGEMNIYHRLNAHGQALFSLASVVEPGSFPENQNEDFSTPGLVLFTQLPGVQEGLSIYSDMLFTGERLAALLNAELHDESRSVLTRQTIEHTRDKILEHRRQLERLRRRR